ncbi:uncharacterized protein J3D65DRAFT_467427 [Phyllosticta citribraziliensis]|uniref:Uncharacterized protein n=1 Tax=Phyllosticta citribraziliensis TaxID=989973 RepID=A0ABR1LFP0_9PEZI
MSTSVLSLTPAAHERAHTVREAEKPGSVLHLALCRTGRDHHHAYTQTYRHVRTPRPPADRSGGHGVHAYIPCVSLGLSLSLHACRALGHTLLTVRMPASSCCTPSMLTMMAAGPAASPHSTTHRTAARAEQGRVNGCMYVPRRSGSDERRHGMAWHGMIVDLVCYLRASSSCRCAHGRMFAVCARCGCGCSKKSGGRLRCDVIAG